VSIQKVIKKRASRRVFRVRNHLKKVSRFHKLRVCVFRSNRTIYAQIIDDKEGRTLLSLSSAQLSSGGDKVAHAKRVGIELGKRAVEQSITDVYFDRGGYLYHGRVKALADGLRESGLQF